MYITCITISDVFVVTGSADETIRKWDMSTCECVTVYSGRFLNSCYCISSVATF